MQRAHFWLGMAKREGEGLVWHLEDPLMYSPNHDLFFWDKSVEPAEYRPLSICFALGNRCNLKCKVCLSNSRMTTTTQYDPLKARELVDALSELVPLRIIWSGGEPTLYPTLRQLVEHSNKLGFFNVVTSNMSCADPLQSLVGSFMYNISIYGIDRNTYRAQTGYDLFLRFHANFESLFDAGHNVCANIRLQSDWEEWLPDYIEWLTDYPIRKLLLHNTILKGRRPKSIRPATSGQLRKLLTFLGKLQLDFPIVYPSTQASVQIKNGYIVVSPPMNKKRYAVVNEQICNDRQDFIHKIAEASTDNWKLFTMQNYI